MNVDLCETSLTGHKLWQLLEKSDKIASNGHQIEEVEAAVVGVGQGFTSKVLRVQLKWSQSADQLPQSVIVKVIGSNAWEVLFVGLPEKAKEKMKRNLFQAHNVECKVYDLQGLNKVVPMPICYAKVPSVGDIPGIIVMQDLSDRGVVLPMSSMGTGFTQGQLESTLEALVSTHAWSVNNTEWRKDIVSLNELNVLETLMEHFLGMFSQSKALYPEILKDLDEAKITQFINSEKFLEIFGGDPKVRYNLPMVLVHGDVHMINMMFDKTADNKAGDKLVALLDWQLAHQGCAMEDMTRLILVCAPNIENFENVYEILRKYVQLFNSKVNNRNDRITFEDVKRSFDEMFSYYTIMWTCGIAMIDNMIQGMHFEDDAERTQFKEKGLKHMTSRYQEARKIMNW